MSTLHIYDYDYVVIGSGFGGSVSALRLSEKGYKVLVVEKGKWFTKPEHFPKTNWQLRKWLWMPKFGLQGLFRINVFRHVAVLGGTGVGGGSLVYANTLPVPKSAFFNSGSWKNLCNWENELKPFYALAKRMLGAQQHPYNSISEKAMQKLAEELGEKNAYAKTDVAVYFGKPGETVADPYFEGKGPDRTGCNLCGGCMLGCRYNAKNTLDKNYLYLAQQHGCEIKAERLVYDVIPLSEDGTDGYEVKFRQSTAYFSKKESVKTRGVVFSGGVLGTMSLLLKLKKTSLPKLSNTLGKGVRTNSESLIGVTTFDKKTVISEGIAIGSIVNIDENRHVEPVKYSAGSGIWRLLMAPMVQGKTMFGRFLLMCKDLITKPIKNLKVFFVDDWSKRTQILLYMESIDSTLQMKRSSLGYIKTNLEEGEAPTAFNPIAQNIAHKMEAIIDGKAMVLATETLLGIPTTAHILGGACMGANAQEGVIDENHRVYNYQNMLICDGSIISANIGVNPSLTITALAERAMTKVGEKEKN
ncbi:MAG: GMC oxidoreductase [Chitinophagales bacterium]|nr:GMC family oxidoreductase [Bacteroidota bacterium]MCB9044059.1 GMC family oxidoreductase [Chitinophagales bacterium]